MAAKVLSQVKSTAAFDSCKQSQERGITIDLGFSSFPLSNDKRITLVDCPGHGSLIKTIICGAQIIDAMMLVIDVTKGIQIQTAECLILCKIFTPKLIVVLNKIDLIKDEERHVFLENLEIKMTKALLKIGLEPICFIRFSTLSNVDDHKTTLLTALSNLCVSLGARPVNSDSLLVASDHCFAVKGKGTVITGTILSGDLSINDSVQIISKGFSRIKKIKSIQVFRETLPKAYTGDRLAMLVTDLDPIGIERGLIAAPNSLVLGERLLVSAQKICHYKLPIFSGSKVHVTVLNETALANVKFVDIETGQYLETMPEDSDCTAVIDFPRSISFRTGIKILGSKLDIEPTSKSCRFLFQGTIQSCGPNDKLETFRWRGKSGEIERIVSDCEIIGKNLIKKDGLLEPYVGMEISLTSRDDSAGAVLAVGKISGAFGTSGKFKVYFDKPVKLFTFPIRLSDYTLSLRYKKKFFI